MPSAYNQDLREKAVKAVDAGRKKSHVCRILSISRNTWDLWLKTRAKTGSIKAKQNYRRGPQPKIKDLEAFCQFVKQHGSSTQAEMASNWSEPERYYDLKLGHKTERISIIAALSCGQILAPMTFVGYCQKSLVEKWVENFLVPELLPGQIVIWDNASFHQGVNLQKLIEGAGCQLLFLPPYSPDLNPIEKFWARLKHYVRKTIKEFDCLQDALNNALKILS